MPSVRYRRVSSQESNAPEEPEPSPLRGRNLVALMSCLVLIAMYSRSTSEWGLKQVEETEQWKEQLARENLQDRSNVHLGSRANGFRLENQRKLDKRRKDMEELDEVCTIRFNRLMCCFSRVSVL